MPVTFRMGREEQQHGFMASSILPIIGCLIAIGALWSGSFLLFCFSTTIIGAYAAFGLQYRFATAKVAAPDFRAKTISLVPADVSQEDFLGQRRLRGGIASFKRFFQVHSFSWRQRLHWRFSYNSASTFLFHPLHDHQPLVATQSNYASAFIVAARSSTIGYALMNLLMTAIPPVMDFCSRPSNDRTDDVIK